MKAKVTEKMCIVQVGYERYMLPQEKAYQLHALLGNARKVGVEYSLPGANRFYIADMTDDITVTHPKEYIDLTGRTTTEIQAFWEHQKARAALMGDTFKVQTWEEYEETQYDRV